jgi:hypothetical protein
MSARKAIKTATTHSAGNAGMSKDNGAADDSSWEMGAHGPSFGWCLSVVRRAFCLGGLGGLEGI